MSVLEESANNSSPEFISVNNFVLLDPNFIGVGLLIGSIPGSWYSSGTIFIIWEVFAGSTE